MKVEEFDYYLPQELIAQHPNEKRDHSRLMVIDRKTDNIEHKYFYDILEYLNEGDCLVLNNSKVIPARIFGKKRGTGANIEFLLIKKIEGDTWQVMVKPGKRVKPGDIIDFSEDFSCHILDFGEDGTRIGEFKYDGIFMEALEKIGSMPLPPYIERASELEDKDRYQTVYCKEEGSVAAPTAGLHFTKELLEKVKEKGVKIAYVTLHVGIGTFRPVKVDDVKDHVMHFEEYEVSEETAYIVNETKKNGGKVIAVGTTSTRTLESATVDGRLQIGNGETSIFIYPGYEFKMVDMQITNFHLPKSTLLMLVSAFYSKCGIDKAYKEAVATEYKFFSYGDAMIII